MATTASRDKSRIPYFGLHLTGQPGFWEVFTGSATTAGIEQVRSNIMTNDSIGMTSGLLCKSGFRIIHHPFQTPGLAVVLFYDTGNSSIKQRCRLGLTNLATAALFNLTLK